ncbi:Suppressor of SWI4 1-like protein [Trichoplax sp. H2]|nr:Suppressor of SWI4 1-like protein [Trichoplax sp. H2]|eukprot:RDD44434.1 Suppressor of SWI4 1-like protein [Trichoplax sp. H2]
MGRKKRVHAGNENSGDLKTPRTFVLQNGKIGSSGLRLMKDLRMVMEPYTARRLKVQHKNSLKDFIHAAGPLGVTHFLIISRTDKGTYLKIAKLPQGPTITFRVDSYTHARDIISYLSKPKTEKIQYKHHPLLVLSGFIPDNLSHTLTVTMFQNMFSSINVEKQYPCRPGRYQNGYGSESEMDDAGPESHVTLPQAISGRGNIKSQQSAIRLTELGPRMTFNLIKIEEGVCTGNVLYHQYVTKTKFEIDAIKSKLEGKKKLKLERRNQQEQNLLNKKLKKEAHRARSLAGMKGLKNMDNSVEDNLASEKLPVTVLSWDSIASIQDLALDTDDNIKAAAPKKRKTKAAIQAFFSKRHKRMRDRSV